MANFLLDLFKGLLFLRAPLEVIFLSCHKVEKTYNLNALRDVHLPKTHGA